MDNLARQGMEGPNRHTPEWKSTLGKHIKDEVHFDTQPTDPQNDIKGTGLCELWNRQVDLIRLPPVQEATHDIEQYNTPSQPPQAEDWQTKVTHPKFQTLPEVTCVYGIDVKCSGTITPQHLIILQDAYNSARHRGVHALLSPPVQDLAAEIQGQLHRLPQLPMTGNNTKAECSHYRALPTQYMTAFCNHALVTKERMASPLDFTPELQDFWTAHPRDSFWFQNRCVFHTIHWILHLPPNEWR